MDSLPPLCPGFRGTLLHNELLSRHTSLKVGGPADLFVMPEDVYDLQLVTTWLDDAKIPRMVIGGGYNLLVKDGGIRGAIISLERLNRIELLDSGDIKAEAGAENLAVVRFGQKRRLGGIGFISGIPGTIGGAVKMNAGAYGNGILDHVRSLVLLREGSIRAIPQQQLNYSYRHLDLLPGDIILAAILQLEQTNPAVTEEEIRKDLELRREKHNVGFPSAGSFFKNPAGQTAWRLIDAAGMRGYRIGDAQMSQVHSNFLVNRGNATAADCLDLSAHIKEAVLRTSGVLLEEEVQIVGNEP